MLKYMIVMFKYLFVLTIAIAVPGCNSLNLLANISAASEPKDGERAKVRMAEGNGGFYIDQNVCGDRPDLSEGHFPLVSDKGSIMSSHWGEMYVRADQQIKVSASLQKTMDHNRYSRCAIAVYFKPEQDRYYEFSIGWADLPSSGHAGRCGLSVSDITGGDIRPVQISKEKLPCN